jgi:DNA-binding IclR family transcriptional regulator
MDLPLAADPTDGFRAKGVRPGQANAARARSRADDLGPDNQGSPGKPVGAVVAAAKVLRTLHASERPLNASEVARAAGLHRGTAYNILRTLQAEGFVGYDDATRSYSVSLHILEIAYGVLRRSGLMDLARPLMHAVSDAHGVSVYLSKVLGPSSLLLLDWVGAALRTDLYATVGRQYPGPAGASGVVMAAFGNGSPAELEALFAPVAWYQKPSFADFLARAEEARQSGFAVDRGTMFQGITQLSVPSFPKTATLSHANKRIAGAPLLHRREHIGHSGIVADAGAQRIGLLSTRFGQSVNRFNGAQDVDMGDPAGFGKVRLHMRTGEDGCDPILQVMAGLILIGVDRRIRQPAISGFVVIFVKGQDQQAVMGFRPLVIAVEILAKPGISRWDAVCWRAVVHIVLHIGNDKGDGRQLGVIGREVGETQV